MTKKILCITNDFGPRAGGIESFVIGLIERMPFGSVTVYTSSQAGSPAFDQAWKKNFGVDVIRDKSKVLLPTPRVARATSRLAQEIGANSAFFGAAAPLSILAPAIRRAGVENIVALTHGHEVWWAKVPPFKCAIRFMGRHTDHLTYLGNFTKSAISRSLSKAATSQMVRIAPGIDTDHFSPQPTAQQLRAELGLSKKKVIVSVGRLVHRKGQDYLVRSLPTILTQHPDAHLLFVGEGPYREHLEKLVAERKLESHVTFIGRVQFKDLPRYICVGDVFAMPSRSRMAGLEVEGLGIVYLEASSCGIPVVGGLSGGAPDAVLEGETGFAVDGTSEEAIANAIGKILSDPELARRMGERGRTWAVEKWRWEIWSKEFNALLGL